MGSLKLSKVVKEKIESSRSKWEALFQNKHNFNEVAVSGFSKDSLGQTYDDEYIICGVQGRKYLKILGFHIEEKCFYTLDPVRYGMCLFL